MVISDYFNDLADAQKVKFRDEVIIKAGVSYPSFYRKLRDNSWRKPEIAIIQSIIDRSNA